MKLPDAFPSSPMASARCILAYLLIAFTGSASAGQLKEARVTQVVKDAKILSTQAAPRPATLSDRVRDGTSVRTGTESRSELTFTDQTIVRLGANTAVRLADGERTLNLDEGAILFQIPRADARQQISTGNIMAMSSGATGLIERHSHYYVKFLLLEGEARVSIPDQIGESIVMRAGQILITKPNGTSLPNPAHFDIARVMKTCRLVSEFRPLANKELIERAEREQTLLTSTGTYIPTNLVIFGRGTLVNLVPPPLTAKNERKTQVAPEPFH